MNQKKQRAKDGHPAHCGSLNTISTILAHGEGSEHMKYVVRGDNGMVVTSCTMDETLGKEVEHNTRAEAQEALKLYESIFLDVKFRIKEV